MSFRKRLLVIVIIVSVIAGILYVGHRDNRMAEEDRENAYYQTQTLYFWYCDDRYTEFLTYAAVDYHKAHPDTRVIPVLVSSSEYLKAVNDASVQGDNYPDLYILSNESLEKAYLAGLACKVLNSGDTLDSRFYSKAALDAVNYHKSNIAYPLSFETTVLMYNKTYLEDWVEKVNSGEYKGEGEGVSIEDMELSDDDRNNMDLVEDGTGSEAPDEQVTLEDAIPKSFDDIYYLSDRYEAGEKVKTLVKWDVSDVLYNYLFLGAYMQVGGDTGDDISLIDIYNENTVECMEAYKKLNEIFAFGSDTDYQTTLDEFLNGEALYTIVSSDAIAKAEALVAEKDAKLDELNAKLAARQKELEAVGNVSGNDTPVLEEIEKIKKDIAAIDVYEYGYAEVPYVKETLKSRTLSVTDAVVINGYSTHKEAADKFANFLSKDCAGDIYKRTGKLASCLSAGYAEGSPESIFQIGYGNSIPLSKLVEASNLWVQLEVTLKGIWDGADSEASLKALSDRIKYQLGAE